MKFPKFWARANYKDGIIQARGWSDHSQQEAQDLAENRLQNMLDRLKSGQGFPEDNYQLYEDSDLICEEVVDRLHLDKEEIAIISRNRYGSRVINSPGVLFIDLDFPPPGCLFGIFSSQKKRLDSIIFRVKKWQKDNPQYSLRLYQTFAGCRAVITNRLFKDDLSEAFKIMRELKADPLYIRLCEKQGCFRARVDPKFWRLGISSPPPGKFPRKPDLQEEMKQWLMQYTHASRGHSTLLLLEELGNSHPLPQIQFICDWQELETRCNEMLPLA